MRHRSPHSTIFPTNASGYISGYCITPHRCSLRMRSNCNNNNDNKSKCTVFHQVPRKRVSCKSTTKMVAVTSSHVFILIHIHIVDCMNCHPIILRMSRTPRPSYQTNEANGKAQLDFPLRLQQQQQQHRRRRRRR